ncbi:MAG TPA: hypothetical protein IAA98_12270 [Candidatus Avipropionibacterium avicola]|uniref:Uncharacterized protein n=1 Tax=Candidatus Avipropionibacterium avicola TaxID=2840701 RepID=A0A9D1KNA9_9ACTN|nr:hypothetical protein [Candidatus Avipropionibacterium avicola]
MGASRSDEVSFWAVLRRALLAAAVGGAAVGMIAMVVTLGTFHPVPLLIAAFIGAFTGVVAALVCVPVWWVLHRVGAVRLRRPITALVAALMVGVAMVTGQDGAVSLTWSALAYACAGLVIAALAEPWIAGRASTDALLVPRFCRRPQSSGS